MKVTTDSSIKERLEALIGWIGKRSEDKAHVNNGDVIADFLDKFMVVELKRLENNPETIPVDIEIPDQVLLEPLLKMKDAMTNTFDDFLTGKGITVPQSGKTPIKLPSGPGEPDPDAEPAEADPEGTVQTQSGTQRTGNGHKVGFQRKLNNTEKNFIRAEFLKINGEFEDAKKSCTAMLPNVGSEITVFQITGFVSFIHREIAAGQSQVGDMPSYMEFMKKHKRLWAQYNSPKYKTLRAAPVQQVAQTSTTPKFRQGKPFKQRTA